MIVVIADTSGLLAALDDNHPDQDAARSVLDEAGAVVVSPVLLSEVDHVGRRALGEAAALSAIDDVRRWARLGRVVLPTVTAGTLDRAQAVRRQCADLHLDLADAVNVVHAADFRTDAILALDRRDFRAIRPLTAHPAFRVLPDDAPRQSAASRAR